MRLERARASWRRWVPWLPLLVKPVRRGVVIFVLLLVIEYLVVPELVGAGRDLYLLGRINAGWIAAGVVLEGVSLFCYAVLTKVLLPPGRKPSLSRLFRIDLSAAAVAHVIPAGTLGTAALGFRLFTTEGISGNDAAVMMAAKGIGSTVVLNVLLWISLVVSIPLAGFQPIYATVAIIGTIVLAGVAALLFGVFRGAGFASRLLRAAGDKIPGLSGERVERAVLDASRSFALLARDRRVLAWSLLWASLNWLLDAASLWCFVAAFGHLANPVELFAAYGIANVAGAFPLTPGGLGVVDSIAPLLLVGFGITRSVATLGVLGWRMVNFWLPIPTGAVAYASLKVKPHSGVSAIRSAMSGLLAEGKPPAGDAMEADGPKAGGTEAGGTEAGGTKAGGLPYSQAMARWAKGERTVSFLIQRGRLESFDAEDYRASAEAMMGRATLRVRTTAVAALGGGDLDGAYVAAYDAYRMAAESLLARQGLRATGGDGSHMTVEDAVSAQFSSDIPVFVKSTFQRFRRTRHSAQYFDPDAAPITRADAAWAIDKASAALRGARDLLSRSALDGFG